MWFFLHTNKFFGSCLITIVSQAEFYLAKSRWAIFCPGLQWCGPSNARNRTSSIESEKGDINDVRMRSQQEHRMHMMWRCDRARTSGVSNMSVGSEGPWVLAALFDWHTCLGILNGCGLIGETASQVCLKHTVCSLEFQVLNALVQHAHQRRRELVLTLGRLVNHSVRRPILLHIHSYIVTEDVIGV